MKAKCAVLKENNKPLDVEYLEIPKLKSGQVLVRVYYAGLCGAQINEIIGLKGEDKYLPHLMGHEGYGTVLSVGSGVTKIRKDDDVVITWIVGYGLEGGPKKYKNCNAGSVTTFQDYSVISENRLVKCPDFPQLFDTRKYAMFGCMIPTGCGTVLNMAKGSIRIFGAGNIGSAAIIAAKQLRHKVYVVDVTKEKLDYALKLGADVVNFPIDKLDKVDTAIDTTGDAKAIEQAFDSISDRGTLIIIGNSKIGDKISLSPFEFIKGKKIIGSWGGGCNPDVDIPFLMAHIDVSNIPIKVFSLDDINKAIEEFKNGFCGKILVEC